MSDQEKRNALLTALSMLEDANKSRAVRRIPIGEREG